MISAGALRLIAYICMTADHTAYVLLNDGMAANICHMAGKLTAPVMFFFAAEGYRHTKSLKAYVARLFAVAALSQIPFWQFTGGSVFFGNVMFTLFLSVIAIHISKSRMGTAVKAGLIILICLLSAASDWGVFGICYALAFSAFDRKKDVVAFLLITGVKVMLLVPCGLKEALAYIPGSAAAAALIYLYDPKGEKRKRNIYVQYAVYPLSFIVLNLIKRIGGS